MATEVQSPLINGIKPKSIDVQTALVKLNAAKKELEDAQRYLNELQSECKHETLNDSVVCIDCGYTPNEG